MAEKKDYQLLIIDGYPKASREEFTQNGMTSAGILYSKMLLSYLPDAQYTILYASDEGVILPGTRDLKKYDGLLWPGCNLTIYDKADERVTGMLDICDTAFEAGIPQFGTCWGIEIAAQVAGGKIEPNPRGREIGIGRKISLTEAGKNHPMFKGKPPVFDHFMSHDDMVTELPENSTVLAGNDFTPIQAAEIKYKNGIFWGLQYHPEYDLREMTRLMLTRKEKMVELGFFSSSEDGQAYIDLLEQIHNEPRRKDLKWKAGIDDDILSDKIRQCEFKNWVDNFLLKDK